MLLIWVFVVIIMTIFAVGAVYIITFILSTLAKNTFSTNHNDRQVTIDKLYVIYISVFMIILSF